MDIWDLMAHWNLVLPPSRPSANQLNRIKKHIKALDRSIPVAVLGSTPEFRDLLVECNFQNIYILERNLNFYKAMSIARVYPNAKETVLNGDWLDTLRNTQNYFSLILSDLTCGNIPYEQRREFYNLISSSLTDKGLFIDKILTHPGENIKLDFLVRKYSNLPLNLLYINYFSCEMLFCSELLDFKSMVDTNFFYDFLNHRIRNVRVLGFVEQAKQITPPGFVWWYGKKWDQLIMDYCPTLDSAIFDEEPDSPYYKRAKHYIFRKR